MANGNRGAAIIRVRGEKSQQRKDRFQMGKARNKTMEKGGEIIRKKCKGAVRLEIGGYIEVGRRHRAQQ